MPSLRPYPVTNVKQNVYCTIFCMQTTESEITDSSWPPGGWLFVRSPVHSSVHPSSFLQLKRCRYSVVVGLNNGQTAEIYFEIGNAYTSKT